MANHLGSKRRPPEERMKAAYSTIARQALTQYFTTWTNEDYNRLKEVIEELDRFKVMPTPRPPSAPVR